MLGNGLPNTFVGALPITAYIADLQRVTTPPLKSMEDLDFCTMC